VVIDLRWTEHGEPAARALHEAVVAAKAGDPLAPVTVVVPSNHVGVASRRLLASGRFGPVAGEGVGVAAVGFLTTYRLAELLGAGALAASGRRPVSTPVLAAAVRAELATDPGLFGPVREHPATEAALVATYRELRDCSPAALDALAGKSARAAEVVRLHRAVRARLAPSWSDEEDLLDAATALVDSPAAAELGCVVVHLPQRLTLHAGRFLAALAEHVPMTVLAGHTGVDAADAEVLTSLARLGITTAGEGPPAPAGRPMAVGRTHILTASDADEEVRAAVRTVVDAVRAGTRLDRIALLHASPEPYARLAHEQLHAAGVATNGASIVPLAARMAGRTILDLLQLPHGRFRRQDVFAWLSSAPMVVGDRWTPTTAWERVSRDAAVVAGREDWDVHLEQLALSEDHQAELAEQDDDQPDWVAERARATAARARELRSFVLGVIDDLTRAASTPRRWSQHAEWARAWLLRLLGPAARRAEWPLDERRAAERIEVSLDRLGALDGIEGPVPLDVFARTLAVELDNDLGRVGRFGDGVLVGSVEMGIGLDLDLVVILGLAEGSFPAPVRDDSLLPDRERAATAGELALRADRVDRQHRQLLATLAGADRQLLCVPRGDLRRSTDRFPSRWVLDVATELAREADPAAERWWAADLGTAEAPWVEHVPSFDAGLRRLVVPATEQEHRLRALLAQGGSLADADDPTTAAGVEVIAARRSVAFTRFDGNLAGLAVESPRARVTSPTRLERWASCPHRHLVEDLLHAAPVENPEEALVITPIHKGNLVHEALERFLEAVLARPEGARPTGRDPWTPDDRAQLEQIGAELCDRYEALGLTGRPIFWRRDRRRILNDLDAFLVADATHRIETGTSPLAAELAFGFGDAEPVSVDLPGGALQVRGRIDRVDRAADGAIHVIDYKTGSAFAYDDIEQHDPIAAGTKLQLPLYGLAGRALVGDDDAPVHAEYWFVTSRGRFRRIGYDVTDEVLERTREVLALIVESIEGGVFPPHPAELSTFFRIDCHVCNPDGLGTAELRKQWERKRHDPALAAYAALAEPEDDIGADGAVEVTP
jgi:hypothetical protein